MSRTVPEWIGRTPNTAIPPRVRVRVFERDGGVCQCGCGCRIAAGMRWETDHAVALINGGENRETNLRTLLRAHHLIKTLTDVADKSAAYERKLSHLGLRKAKRPMPCGRQSKWKKKFDGSVVLRDGRS